MNVVSERRALEAMDEALGWPEEEQEARFEALAAADPALAARIARLLGIDASARRSLPTQPPEPLALSGLSAPPERIGVYRLTELLGEGGMGAVWRGEREDGLFDQSVAIKLMRPGLFAAAALAQFNTERRVLARLQHPNIAQLFDGGADPEGRAYFIMERVEGAPLTHHAEARGLDLKAKVDLVLPICAAVQYAHQALVVHADIKPGNILIDPEGRPKLLDFGIARNLRDEEEAGGIGLTFAYASPQRREGERPTPSDDVYALGALLWELATGAPPDQAPPAPLPPTVPAEIAAIVTKATATEPTHRYESAGALADDLLRWRRGYPVRALPQSARRSAAMFTRRRPWSVTAAVAGLVGLIVALTIITGLYLRSERERREADHRFAQARGMAHYMLFDLFDRLTDTPGTLPIRRDLADKARLYLHDLSAARRAPIEVKAEAAIGYMQLAGVEALFSAGQLGERRNAGTALGRAEALLRTGGPEAERNPRWRHAEGRLKLFQGFRELDQGGGGRVGMPLLSRSIALLRSAAKELPNDPEVAGDLFQAELTLADAVKDTKDYAGSIALVRQALADYQGRRPALAKLEKAPLLLARAYKLIGDAQYYGGDKAASVESFARAERIIREEDARHPRRSRTLVELMDAQWNLGGALAEVGRKPAALKLYELAAAEGRARLQVEPDHETLIRATNLVELERAALLATMSRREEALTAARANLQDRKDQMSARGGDMVSTRTYLAGLRQTGEVELAAGDKASACAHFREGLAGYADFRRRYALSERVSSVEAAGLTENLKGCG